MPFSAVMRARAGPLLERILAHPYNRALVAGTLDPAIFSAYVVQDALYLLEYGRVLAALAARASTADGIHAFAQAAVGAIDVERALHAGFFAQLGVDPDAAARAEPSPTCRAYTDFLHTSVHVGGYAVGCAAVLPCFRVYYDVGCRLAPLEAPGNRYTAWIATYAAAEFGAIVERAEALADAAWTAAGPADRAAMIAAYDRSVVYEWMFWDAAWRRDAWPVSVR
ncbi:MAG: TenA family protein [Gemmatimonadaceae bacterium]|nr:TenA family protein [Gemmatimonadaceae bacterium]